MLSQQLRTLFNELGYEVYLNRTGETCLRYAGESYEQHQRVVKDVYDILCRFDGSTIGGRYNYDLGWGSPVMSEFLIIDLLKGCEWSFSISSLKDQKSKKAVAEKATIKIEHYEQGENFNDVTITLNKDGSIKIDTAYNNCCNYSLDDATEEHKALAEYLKNTDPRIMPFVKYCAHVMGSQNLTLLINAIQEYQKGKKLVLIPMLPVSGDRDASSQPSNAA